MHYIVGTSLSIRPNLSSSSRRLRQFVEGRTYTLKGIAKNNDLFVYTFISSHNDTAILEFESCRDADTFISSIKNEVIPDYQSKENSDVL